MLGYVHVHIPTHIPTGTWIHTHTHAHKPIQALAHMYTQTLMFVVCGIEEQILNAWTHICEARATIPTLITFYINILKFS